MRESTRIVTRVYTGEQARAFDRNATRDLGIDGFHLMLGAGRAAFDTLRARWPLARSVSVVCGTGNNAGDGYLIAAYALDAGLDVQLVQIGDPHNISGEALLARRQYESRGASVEAAPEDWHPCGDVVVDALLGTGLRGKVRPAYQCAIATINASGRPVLAVDVPSGVDAGSGALGMPEPVRADCTVTFVAAKIGLFTGLAVDYAGEVVFADLDLPAAVYDRPGIGVLQGAGLAEVAQRRPSAHKGEFGHLLIVGGEADMGGAVLLAGEAALRTGAGLVTVATRSANRTSLIACRPELMVRAAEAAEDIEDLVERADVIAVGPGLGSGDWGRGLLVCCIESGKPLVVDADGLNGVAGLGLKLPAETVVTPHPGEAGTLLGKPTAWIQAHRAQAASALAQDGVVAVLKGAGTLIAADGAVQSICLGGNPGMATPGSGDVLTGIVGALRATGAKPRQAAELGVWLHSRAGDEAAEDSQAALLAGDLIDALRLTP